MSGLGVRCVDSGSLCHHPAERNMNKSKSRLIAALSSTIVVISQLIISVSNTKMYVSYCKQDDWHKGGSNLSPLIGCPQLPQNQRLAPTFDFLTVSQRRLHFPSLLSSLPLTDTTENGFEALPCRPSGRPSIVPAAPQVPMQSILRWAATFQ